jgi:hypothetical protein
VSAVDLIERSDLALALARRAVDLSRDGRVPICDGAEHLVRLAMGRREVLKAALSQLEREPSTSEIACAHLLVTAAIDRIERTR